MKRITPFLIVLTTLCVVSLTACDDKEPIGTMYSGFMTGYTDSEGYISVLCDDFGKRYMVSEKTDKLEPDTLYRIVASVTLDENQNAQILQMASTISYPAPENAFIADSLRVKDPVEIQSIFIGGGYLNIHLGIKVAKEGTLHRLFYARLDNTDKVKFTIYHNAYHDGQVYTKYAYISIPLQGYNLAKNDTVFLSCKGYEEDYDYKLVYK